MFYAEMHPKILAKNPVATKEEIDQLIEYEWQRLKKCEKKVLKDLAQKSVPPINHVHAKKFLEGDPSLTSPPITVVSTYKKIPIKTSDYSFC